MKFRRTVSLLVTLILLSSMSATNVFAAAISNTESAVQTEETTETQEDLLNSESSKETLVTQEEPTNLESVVSTDETAETLVESLITETVEPKVETSEDVIYDTENGEIIGVGPTLELKPEVSPNTRNSDVGERIDSVLTLGKVAALDASDKIIVKLPQAGDTKTFNMQIDHSLYPEAKLCVFTYEGLGDCTINISDIGSYTIRTKTGSISTGFNTKYIININGTGGIKDYTVTVSTSAGSAGCALILATQDTLAEKCGGQENATYIQKNESTDYGVTWFGGYQSLLKGDGEWFRYTADGDTYIHAYASMLDDLVVSVYDADTGIPIKKTETEDSEIQRESATDWTGHVSKKFVLQSGHEYLFQVQSGSANGRMYGFSVGLPSTIYDMVDISSTSTYTIPSNTTKVFTFKVSGYPNSTRLSDYGRISFQTSSVTSNLDIASCKITAPNGRVYIAPSQGQYSLSQPVDYNNYFTNPNNVPLNGTWTVAINSKSVLSGLKFKISAGAVHIPGSDGNE